MPSTFEWTAAVVLSFVLTFVAHGLFSAEAPASYFKQWCIYMFLDSAWGNLFHLLLLVPARWIAARLVSPLLCFATRVVFLEPHLTQQESSLDQKYLRQTMKHSGPSKKIR